MVFKRLREWHHKYLKQRYGKISSYDGKMDIVLST